MRKKNETQTEPETGASSASRLTPADVQNKEFGLSFRGYTERDVDEFLDRVTEDLAWYIDENRKLRSQLASSGYVDPKEWGANAEAAAGDLLMRARQEADRIVREAEARAAAIGTAGASDQRSIVAPYLNRERDFLQSLGGLVQEHAETIRAMVKEARRREDAQPPQTAGETAGETAEPVPPPNEAPVDAIEEEPAASAPITITDDTLEEPSGSADAFDERAVVGSPGDAPGRGEDDDQHRSLRELFWGND